METIASSCAAVLRGLPPEISAILAWPLAAGPMLAAHARVEGCRAGTLAVAVPDPAWRAEIERMRPELLRALQALLPPGAVRQIALQAGGRA